MEYKWYKYDDNGVQDSFNIRMKVFCEELGFAKDTEVDANDPKALHLATYDENVPVCTARIFIENGNVWHFGRLACLPSARGKGFGKVTLLETMKKCKSLGGEKIILGAKYDKVGFYRNFGFADYSDIFYDEGVPHIMMSLDITNWECPI